MFGLTVTVAASGLEFQSHCAHDGREERTNLQGSIAEPHGLFQVQRWKAYSSSQATFMALYHRRETMVQHRAPAPPGVDIKPSQVAQYVQPVKKYTGTLVPNQECSPGGASVVTGGDMEEVGGLMWIRWKN